MNHIKRLQEENAEMREKLAALDQEIRGTLGFLTSPKFQGYESDGGRKDWISTGDVDQILRRYLNLI